MLNSVRNIFIIIVCVIIIIGIYFYVDKISQKKTFCEIWIIEHVNYKNRDIKNCFFTNTLNFSGDNKIGFPADDCELSKNKFVYGGKWYFDYFSIRNEIELKSSNVVFNGRFEYEINRNRLKLYNDSTYIELRKIDTKIPW